MVSASKQGDRGAVAAMLVTVSALGPRGSFLMPLSSRVFAIRGVGGLTVRLDQREASEPVSTAATWLPRETPLITGEEA
jgi:hypothetical protein